MSGHSKWSKVKHQKASTDSVKAMSFTKASRALFVAVRQGGSADPEKNFRLRLAIEKAKAVNMPKDTIERSIQKASGSGAEALEEAVYEAFGPHGIALLIEAATDNRQRTVALIKHALHAHGATLADPGAVAYLFERKGIIKIKSTNVAADSFVEMLLEAGADDYSRQEDMYEVTTRPEALIPVYEFLRKSGIEPHSHELFMSAVTPIVLGEEEYRLIEKLAGALEELDDVQRVYSNAAPPLKRV